MIRSFYLAKQNVANWIDKNNREFHWLNNNGKILNWNIDKIYYNPNNRINDKLNWYDEEHPKFDIIIDILYQLISSLDRPNYIAIIGDSTIDHYISEEFNTYHICRRETGRQLNRALSNRLNRDINILYECVCGSGYDGDQSFYEQLNRVFIYEKTNNIYFDTIINIGGWNSNDLTENEIKKYTKELFNLFNLNLRYIDS